MMESLGGFLKRSRELQQMSLSEVARRTRIPLMQLEHLESDRFAELPGEVFIRGFLKAYAQAVRLDVGDVVSRYTSTRRVSSVVEPLPVTASLQATQPTSGGRFGVAIALVLILILFTVALSIVLKPRGRDLPDELSHEGSWEIPLHNS